MDKIARIAKIRKLRTLFDVEYALAQGLQRDSEDLFLVTTTVERVEGDPVSFLKERAGLGE